MVIIYMNYGNNLESLRERLGLTQKEVGNLLNVDKSLYRRYEKELQTIPIKHLNTLCNYYNVSLDFIFNLTKEKNYSNNSKDINSTKSGERLTEFRKDNSFTQDKLSLILNVNRTTITKYEKGINLIATPFLYTICKKYNISADYLLGKTDEPKYL